MNRTGYLQIIPAIVNFIEKLDGQLHKAFQSTPASSMQYLHRLRDECVLLKQLDEAIEFLSKLGEAEKVARVSLMKLEHIYYKNDSIYEKTKEALKGQPEKLAEIYIPEGNSADTIESIVQ